MPKPVTKRASPVVSYLRLDLRGLVRPALWGSAAIVSLLAVALATQTATGQSRIATAYGAITGSSEITAFEREQKAARREHIRDIEATHLTEVMRTLSEDRDQLLARMAVLERNYEDVTGSIGRLTAPPNPATEQLFPIAPSTELAPVIPPPQPTAPIATISTAQPERDTTTTPPTEPAQTASARTEFGIDLGGGATLAAMRAAWNQIRRNHATLLDGLRPVIGVRDGKGGQVDLRLIVGPFSNAAVAAKFCASLTAAGQPCQPATFDGQRLALR